MSGVSAYSPPTTTKPFSSLLSKPQITHYCNLSGLAFPSTPSSSDLKLKGQRFGGAKGSQILTVQCNSSNRPGESDNKSVLDAFFLGKALAEAINERIESTVGEFLSQIGRLQAEQQKQVQDFQEEVFERAKRAKEKAAREAVEAQGLIPKSTVESTTSVTVGVTASTSPSASNASTPANSPPLPDPTDPVDEIDQDPNYKDPVSGVSNED